jgi:hypothetical protein
MKSQNVKKHQFLQVNLPKWGLVYDVVFIYCDIAGNEISAKLARRGSAAIFCGPEPALPLSGSIIQLMTKQYGQKMLI